MEEPQKVILSNRLYFKPENNTQLKYIMDQLTYKIENKKSQKGKFKNIEIIRNYKVLPKGIISIPQGRLDLVPDGLQLVDKRVLNPVPFPNPKFELREGQQVVYDEVADSCFINALVGWGKFCPTLK